MEKRTVIYYTDELNEEFSLAQITPRAIDKSYVYERNTPWQRLAHLLCYRVVATPIAFLYTKLKFHHKTVNRRLLRPWRKTGYFLYGNHTQDIGDAFIPNMINFPKENHIIVHPNNVSMPLLGRITPYLGALPLPDDRAAYRNFTRAIEHKISDGRAVIIYPEAHIWPYYTKIRPFPDDSFCYPVKHGAPVFCFTNTYQKRRFSKKPKIVTYVDGPFFADPEIPARRQKKELRDRVYATMCERAKRSNTVRIQYVRKEAPTSEQE